MNPAAEPPGALHPAAARPAPPGLSPARLRRLGALTGIIGPLLLIAYFTTPAVVGWPSAGATPDQLATYATTHQVLFFLGGWLQATGAVASVVFFLALLQLSGAANRLAGPVVLVGAAVLLSVVLIEAALLEAVPIAAAAGDQATVATAFALSNGVFARIFPLAPAPLLFAGTGYALRGHRILPRWVDRSALVIAALFVVAGLAAVFGTPGLILAIVLSIVEALWIAGAAVALAAGSGPVPPPGPVGQEEP